MPCVIEANKTIDYKSFYKSSDISQMMFVHGEDNKLKNLEEIDKFDPFKVNGIKGLTKILIFVKLFGRKTLTINLRVKMGYLNVLRTLEQEDSRRNTSTIPNKSSK